MNLTSILSEIKVVPVGSAGGLVPGDFTSADFRHNFYRKIKEDDPTLIELKINIIDKVKETPKNYRVWLTTLTVYFYLETKTYEVKGIEPEPWHIKGDLYSKDWNPFKDKNNLSGLSSGLDYMKKAWKESKFKENKVDLEVLKDIVDAFYNQYSYGSDSMKRVVKSSKEELFKKAYKELKKAEDSFVKVKDKIAQDNLDWIEPIALDLIQKYSNADISTYKKS